MTTVPLATTVPYGVILQLDNAPSFYSTPPAYQSVKIAPITAGSATAVDQNFWIVWQAENAASKLLANDLVFET